MQNKNIPLSWNVFKNVFCDPRAHKYNGLYLWARRGSQPSVLEANLTASDGAGAVMPSTATSAAPARTPASGTARTRSSSHRDRRCRRRPSADRPSWRRAWCSPAAGWRSGGPCPWRSWRRLAGSWRRCSGSAGSPAWWSGPKDHRSPRTDSRWWGRWWRSDDDRPRWRCGWRGRRRRRWSGSRARASRRNPLWWFRETLAPFCMPDDRLARGEKKHCLCAFFPPAKPNYLLKEQQISIHQNQYFVNPPPRVIILSWLKQGIFITSITKNRLFRSFFHKKLFSTFCNQKLEGKVSEQMKQVR